MQRIDISWVNQNVRHRSLVGHKKTFGHVLVVAGSPGKIGAGILCARAALHSGCGMVTAMIPEEGVSPLLSASPEIMYIINNKLSDVDLSNFDSIAIGPGIGLSKQSEENLFYLLENYKGPTVIDADALTLLSKNLSALKTNHIITPHPGEFERLQQVSYNEAKREKQAEEFVKKNSATLVLKGAPSLVLSPNHEMMLNTTGNDGMATAGSGDVLTGIIASLCAQGYETKKAASLGVFLHGMAGDLAIKEKSKASLVASDLIEYLSLIRLLD